MVSPFDNLKDLSSPFFAIRRQILEPTIAHETAISTIRLHLALVRDATEDRQFHVDRRRQYLTLVDLSIFTLAYKLFELPIVAANVMAWLVAVSGSYIMK